MENEGIPREPAERKDLNWGNYRASVDTASASLDSRTATEPVISSRLLLPPPPDLHPLHRSLEPPRIVCRVVLQPSVAAECNGDGGGGGGNRPEPDARLQVQEALTRGSYMRENSFAVGFSI